MPPMHALYTVDASAPAPQTKHTQRIKLDKYGQREECVGGAGGMERAGEREREITHGTGHYIKEEKR